ncbi:OLC1v1000744C1 [Oldenlandia corymbosa var. corymbosa]|uniref:non-specific serine/threonine protein kinase n=1 Tax=Oldenlandia corymbosa var. corymbosa TaxID=529605 RepID=A0AAV1D5V4_OLDCO|nr:OLC1v1000744C1 [Oldenlandia corymbosa var. corymbosa]
MKHIFKKLHHHPNRSNETSSQPSLSSAATSSSTSASSSSSSASSAVSDHRSSTPSGNSVAVATATATTAGSTAIGATTTTAATSPTTNRQQLQQRDYYTSQEDYEMELALALSVSASSAQDSSLLEAGGDHRHQILLGGRLGDTSSHRDDAAADLLSRQYWDYSVLDYGEKVVEGFYDVFSLSMDPSIRGRMPSLTDIEANPGGSDFEVVIVNWTIDPDLQELIHVAQCIKLDYPTTNIGLLVQRVAELVTDHMGGPVKDANVFQARWMERSTDLRISLHTAVLPLGSLRLGLSRHRALLFKVLADNIGIPCRLVKGSHYTGIEDDAVNIIKLPDESEFLVDLMGEPGALIPADVLSAKDTSLKSYDPKLSKVPSLPVGSDSGTTKISSGPSSTEQKNYSSGKELKTDSLPSLPDEISIPDSTSGVGQRVPLANQMDHLPSLALGKSFYKGGRRPNVAADGGRMNVHVAQKRPDNSEDPKDLFADLNPFLIKGSGKVSVQGNKARKNFDGLQQPWHTLAVGQPPVPIVGENSAISNPVPKKNEYAFSQSSFAKSSHANDDPSRLSLPSTSSNAPGKAISNSNFYSNSYNPFGDGQNASGGDNLASIDGRFNDLFLEDHSERHQKDGKIQQISELNGTNGDGKNINRMLEEKNNKQEMTLADSRLGHQDKASSSIKSGLPHVDPVIDDVSECEIPWEDLVIGERIGLGSYGEVYHADWNGTEVAVKKFLDQDFSGAALDEFRREVRIMQRLRHPNVVLFMGAVTRPPNLSIVTEFLPRGSLYRIIHRPQCQIDEKRRIKMALDVAKGMNCLHTSIPTIVHRDLKSPNLLVDKNWNVKVADFGLSRLKHNTFLSSKSTAGTPEWMAPEVLRNEPSNEKCDVYSFGIILWELATLRLPWSGMNPMQVVGAVGFQNRRPEIPKEVDPLVARIIWECWQTDPNLRPSFAQLTVALKSLQRLVIPSHVDQPNSPPMPQEISVNSTP